MGFYDNKMYTLYKSLPRKYVLLFCSIAFAACLIDEVTQATEPDCLVPIVQAGRYALIQYFIENHRFSLFYGC